MARRSGTRSCQWIEHLPSRSDRAKYVRLILDVRTAGRVGNLGIYSAAPVFDFTMPRPRKIAANELIGNALKIDFADLHGQVRIIFVSSGRDLRLAQ